MPGEFHWATNTMLFLSQWTSKAEEILATLKFCTLRNGVHVCYTLNSCLWKSNWTYGETELRDFFRPKKIDHKYNN